jgi:hypothetical protein
MATSTYSEDCQNYLGVDDEILSEGLNLYPNPVSNMLNIESKLSLRNWFFILNDQFFPNITYFNRWDFFLKSQIQII